MHPDLQALAAAQGGTFTVHQARQFHSRREILNWRSLAWIEKVEGKVWRLGGSPMALTERVLAAQLHIGRPLILCAHTAASMHGFGVISDELIHVTTESGWSKSMPPGFVLHQAPPRQAPVQIGQLLVTHAADTAVDLARAVAPLDVLPVLDAAYARGVNPRQLTDAADLAGRRRGMVKVRRWIPYADPRAGSPMESRTRFRLIEGGLPAPELQIEVVARCGQRRFLDMGYDQVKVGVDYEGEEFHTGTGAMESDRARHNEMADLGWRMFYPTAADVYQRSAAFVGMVRRAHAA